MRFWFDFSTSIPTIALRLIFISSNQSSERHQIIGCMHFHEFSIDFRGWFLKNVPGRFGQEGRKRTSVSLSVYILQSFCMGKCSAMPPGGDYPMPQATLESDYDICTCLCPFCISQLSWHFFSRDSYTMYFLMSPSKKLCRKHSSN